MSISNLAKELISVDTTLGVVAIRCNSNKLPEKFREEKYELLMEKIAIIENMAFRYSHGSLNQRIFIVASLVHLADNPVKVDRLHKSIIELRADILAEINRC